MPYLDWKQAPEVRSYLESAREKCKKLKERLPNSNREGLEPDVQDICQTLEAAYKESLKSHRTRYDESHIIFAGKLSVFLSLLTLLPISLSSIIMESFIRKHSEIRRNCANPIPKKFKYTVQILC